MAEMLELCATLPIMPLATGEVLIHEGDGPGRMYVLVEGAVTVERDGVAFARIDSPGAVFGEMAVILDKPATATIRASRPSCVRVVVDPLAFLSDQPGAALEVLRTTASRLDGLTQYLVDVKSQFAGMEGHLGMVDSILDTLVHHQGPRPRTGSARDPHGADPHDH